MITVIDPTPPSRTTTLNDIPLGQVFKGTIVSHTGNQPRTGTFLKVTSRWHYANTWHASDVLVVALDLYKPGGTHRFWVDCCTVLNYEPVTATLTLTKGQD